MQVVLGGSYHFCQLSFNHALTLKVPRFIEDGRSLLLNPPGNAR